jgi:RNA polymerase sigma factor (TIGR02999 family)
MPTSDLTALLEAASDGDREALDALFSATYDELKSLAHQHRARWSGNPTMGTTVLVHEAYQKLVRQRSVRSRDRAHFLALAARAMRHILVNYAERQSALKRGGGEVVLSLDDASPMVPEVAEEVLALHRALERMSADRPRASRVVECRFFAGMTMEETAEALDVSPATVKRDWTLATAWLRDAIRLELGAEQAPGA